MEEIETRVLMLLFTLELTAKWLSRCLVENIPLSLLWTLQFVHGWVGNSRADSALTSHSPRPTLLSGWAWSQHCGPSRGLLASPVPVTFAAGRAVRSVSPSE